MIELMTFLHQLVKKIPDYKEFGRVYLELDNGSYDLIITQLKTNSIAYRFSNGGRAAHDWNPRGAAYYRYIVDRVSEVHLNIDNDILGRRPGGVRIHTSKVFWKEGLKKRD
jgi:hypothetical protein